MTIQAFNIDDYGFRKTRNENPSTWEKVVTSLPLPAALLTMGKLAGTG